MSSLDFDCEKHSWAWSSDDDMGCPRCYEVNRILKIIDNQTLHYGKTHSPNYRCNICDLITLIEGEQ
jgi:hypothetical protein